ncbi:unnamed protein product [Sphagnum balticum]
MKKHLLAALSLAFCAAIASSAHADNSFSLHLEPGLAQPIASPQSNIYTTGLALDAKGLFMLDHYISVGPSISTMYLPRSIDNGQNAGTLWQFGGSARLQTDRRTSATWLFEGKLNPWVDLDAMLANTGNLQRPAFDVAIGAETPLDQNHIFWMGPFIRYTHVFQTASTQDSSLLDSRDVNVLQVGLSFSFDAPTNPQKELVERNNTVVVEKVTPSTPCPPVMATTRVPQRVVELSETVYFDRDSANLRWESRDKLDAIVRKLNETPTLSFKVEGHASSDGQFLHNVELSSKRAMSVVNYLVQHGIELKRLQVASLGISKPNASNKTQEGRERNRRTEVTVTFTSIETK